MNTYTDEELEKRFFELGKKATASSKKDECACHKCGHELITLESSNRQICRNCGWVSQSKKIDTNYKTLEYNKNLGKHFLIIAFLLVLFGSCSVYPIISNLTVIQNTITKKRQEDKAKPSQDVRLNSLSNNSLPSDFGKEWMSEAIKKGSEASCLSKSAKTHEDWRWAAKQWKDAINFLNIVPESSKSYSKAREKILEYQKYVSYTEYKANLAEGITANTNNLSRQESEGYESDNYKIDNLKHKSGASTTEGHCDYPWQRDSRGRRCGKRAASIRPGGRQP
jgi:hypothetical protein